MRDIIKHTQIIVSTLVDTVRSTGDMFSSGVNTPYYRFDTVIADTDYFDNYTQLMTASNNYDTLNRVGAISLDGLFVPYTTFYDSTGILPHFTKPTNSGAGSVYTLNPFNPSNKFASPGTGWAGSGHNITAALLISPTGTQSLIDAGITAGSNYFGADFYYRKKAEITNVRSIAHRAPMILSGWGYDTGDNPIPSGIGTASSGLHPQALYNPSLWKTGPLDVRWNENKGVWGTPSETQILSFMIVSSDPITKSALVDIQQRSFTGAAYGSILEDTVVTVYDTDGCYLSETNIELTARKGKAILMYVNSGAAYIHFSGITPPTKYWNVMSICCPSLDCTI